MRGKAGRRRGGGGGRRGPPRRAGSLGGGRDRPASLGPEAYAGMELGAALGREAHFARACRELAVVLAELHGAAPKVLQQQMFRDALAAVRAFASHRNHKSAGAMGALAEAVEQTLPRKKAMRFVRELKEVEIIKRRQADKGRGRPAGDATGDVLPLGVLEMVFGRLDAYSLAMCLGVNKRWHACASKDAFWLSHYRSTFQDSPKKAGGGGGAPATSSSSPGRGLGLYWVREYSKRTRRGGHVWASHRAACRNCGELFWLSSFPPSPWTFSCSPSASPSLHQHVPIHVPINAICSYVASYSSSSSEDDSDSSDDEFVQMGNSLERLRFSNNPRGPPPR